MNKKAPRRTDSLQGGLLWDLPTSSPVSDLASSTLASVPNPPVPDEPTPASPASSIWAAGFAFSVHRTLVPRGELDSGQMTTGLLFYNPPETAYQAWNEAYPNLRWIIQIDRVDRTGDNFSLDVKVWRGKNGAVERPRHMTLPPADLSAILKNGLPSEKFETESRP